MTTTLRPHDLIWLTARDALEGITESWVDAAWHTGLPVVVRRDVDNEGRIPVGVRGLRRDQRAAGWVKPENVLRVVSPEDLSVAADLLRSPFITQPPVQVALQLAQQSWPWTWGITGSTGYALATGIPVIHADSDLDLLIRAPCTVSLRRLLTGRLSSVVRCAGRIHRWIRPRADSRWRNGYATAKRC